MRLYRCSRLAKKQRGLLKMGRTRRNDVGVDWRLGSGFGGCCPSHEPLFHGRGLNREAAATDLIECGKCAGNKWARFNSCQLASVCHRQVQPSSPSSPSSRNLAKPIFISTKLQYLGGWCAYPVRSIPIDWTPYLMIFYRQISQTCGDSS